MHCTECGHDPWDHELIEESCDWLLFGKCEIEGCKCEQYEGD